MLRSEKIKNILIENNKLLTISKNVCSFYAYKNKFFYNKNQIAFFEKHEGRYKIIERLDSNNFNENEGRHLYKKAKSFHSYINK